VDGTATITESNVTLDQVSLTMKSLIGYTTAPHNVLKQSTPVVEELLRSDLAQTLATALDKAAIQGSGVSSEPTGVANQTGVGSVLHPNGGDPSWSNVVDLELAIDVDNAATENMAQLTTPTMFATLKKTERATGTASFIVEGNPTGKRSRMNGYGIQSTLNCPSGTVILGDWSQLLIDMWGGL